MSGQYRFLPWTRQGLISHVRTPDTLGSDMPGRAEFPVRVRVNDATPAGVDLSLYGPGDIIGIDPRGIVRLDPRRLATDVEPNYMPAIEFDRPDFPWMFTPAAAGPSDRLRPWCVLVVVCQQDGVAIAQLRDRPLPTLTIEAPASATEELPDLAESWAWAHAQVITEEDTAEAVETNLRSEPTLNVSRVVSPRRLEPNRRYLACLVPAFAVGVQAGLGRPVPEETNLVPAWSDSQAEVELPVYYHWEFGTGPGGDFESLAAKLQPPTEPLDVGVSPMFIGDAGSGLPNLAATEEGATLDFEGALVGPDHDAPDDVDEIPESFLDSLNEMLDAPHAALAGNELLALPIAPPLYGRWHAGQHVVPEEGLRWLRELNLDPRYRAAAGLGAEVVRANQEELMHDAWQQVGNVLGANQLLNIARFAKEAAVRLHSRAIVPLDTDRLFRITSPLHSRVLVGASTVRQQVHQSVIPDATEDPAFRRLSGDRSPLLRRAGRRTTAPVGGVEIVESINSGKLTANPTRVLPDALVNTAAIAALKLPRRGPVDLGPIGGKAVVDVALVRSVASEAAAVDTTPEPGAVRARPNLSSTGIVVKAHLGAVVATAEGNETMLVSSTLGALVDSAEHSPNAAGFLLPSNGGSVAAIDVDRSGIVTARPTGGEAATVLGRISARDAGRGGMRIDEVLEAGRVRPITPAGRPRPTPPDPTLPSTRPSRPAPQSMPRLVKRPDAIRRLKQALATHVDGFQQADLAVREPQPLALGSVRTELLRRTDPGRVVPRRISSMVRIGDQAIASTETSIVRVRGELEPLLAAPLLPGPMYEALAEYAEERLLPGIDRIEANTVGLLKTNPRFVEAFLIGANVELGGEFLWREYPAPRGITPMRHFWDRDDGAADIPPIADFNAGFKLGSTALGGAGGQMVLLIRGDLLRRYPTTSVYAVSAGADGKLSKAAGDHHEPIMRGFIDPDLSFVGFDLSRDDVLSEPGYFFVLQQQATEPRFGFDIPTAGDKSKPVAWRDATWGHVEVEAGEYLAIGDNAMEGERRNGATFVTNSAHLAAITLQQPVRVAIHASDLIPQGAS